MVTNMKRLLSILIAVILAFSLSACQSNQKPELGLGKTNSPGSNGLSKPTAVEPPMLKVQDNLGNSVEAVRGTYSWMYDTGNGRWTGVEADSAHPLQSQEFLIPLETASNTVTLSFDVQPQDVTVQCWRDVLFGNADASGEHIPIDGNTLELKGGGYVYEICANWTGENLAVAGTAHYSFYAIWNPDDHEHKAAEFPQIVDDPVSGYCGNTITSIYLDGKEYAFMGTDSVNLNGILINLKYDPMRVCRCAPELTVKTEFGEPYGVNLTQGYARCEEGQADLTAEQIDLIRKIIDNQT